MRISERIHAFHVLSIEERQYNVKQSSARAFRSVAGRGRGRKISGGCLYREHSSRLMRAKWKNSVEVRLTKSEFDACCK